jgi:spore coat-associated protein N
MNRKILFALLSIAVVAALVGVATYALFSSTVSSTGNQFEAGTMNLTVNGGTQLAQLNFANLTPGWTDTETYVLHNGGTVMGRGELYLQNFTDPGQLADNIDVAITQDDAQVFTGKLRDLAASPNDLDILNGGDDSTITAQFSIDPSVGNQIQNDTATFDLGFSLTSEPTN